MNLIDFYDAKRNSESVKDKAFGDRELKTMGDKLIADLTTFVEPFGLRGVKMQVVSKIPKEDSPVKFAFGILMVKMDPDPKKKRAMMACEFGVNILKLTGGDTVNKIFIRPRLKSLAPLDANFLDRYVEFIQGHLQIFGNHVKVIKK